MTRVRFNGCFSAAVDSPRPRPERYLSVGEEGDALGWAGPRCASGSARTSGEDFDDLLEVRAVIEDALGRLPAFGEVVFGRAGVGAFELVDEVPFALAETEFAARG